MKLRLDEKNRMKDHFIDETQKRETMTKTLTKYIVTFDYVDQTLLILSKTTGGVSIARFPTVIGMPVSKVSERLGLVFSFHKGIENKVIKQQGKMKET